VVSLFSSSFLFCSFKVFLVFLVPFFFSIYCMFCWTASMITESSC
jgi:hypothetical protein